MRARQHDRIAAPWRVAVDNDFAGDPDGLVSLAHLLLGDEVRVELVTTSLLDPALSKLAGADPQSTAAAGVDRVIELYEVAGAEPPPIVAGAESREPAAENAAARALAAWAAKTHGDEPRLLLCGGPLTNIAAALRMDPDLPERVRLVWIGGTPDGTAEYNRDTDPVAAKEVFESKFDIVQIPRDQYLRLRYSLAEIADGIGASGSLGHWLVERLLDVPAFVTLRAALTLGDSGLVAAVALDPGLDPVVSASRRVVCEVDARLVWGDLTTLLRRSAAND